MKFFVTITTLAGFVGTGLADGTAIVSAMDDISADTAGLNSTVASWKGDLLGTLGIITKSITLLSSINAATEDSEELNDIEAVTVAIATQDLVADTNSTLQTIIAARPKFDRLLLRPIILLNLDQQKDASDKFSAAILDKVPEELQSAAETLVAQLDAVFATALEAYKLF